MRVGCGVLSMSYTVAWGILRNEGSSNRIGAIVAIHTAININIHRRVVLLSMED